MSFTLLCEEYKTLEEFLQHCKVESSGKTREVIDVNNEAITFGFAVDNCKIIAVDKKYKKALLEVPEDARAALRSIRVKVFDGCESFINGSTFGLKISEAELQAFSETYKKDSYVRIVMSFKSVITFEGSRYVTFNRENISVSVAPTVVKKKLFDV